MIFPEMYGLGPSVSLSCVNSAAFGAKLGRSGTDAPAGSDEMRKPGGLRLLLIDDDPVFGSLLVHLSKSQGIHLEHYHSLFELGRVGRFADFDGVILDYYLDDMNGSEVAEYLNSFVCGMPVIICSGRWYSDDISSDCSPSVKAFVPKVLGVREVLRVAIAETLRGISSVRVKT